MYETTGHISCIADRDVIIAVAGAPKKQFLERRISPAVEKAMETRRTLVINDPGTEEYCATCPVIEDNKECKFSSQVIAPIIAEGDPIGAVILSSMEPNVKMTDLETKLVETAAGFLAKQMEH